MAIRDIFKVSRKTFINPRGWLGYDDLKEQNRTIWEVLKAVFTPMKATRTETFDQAMQRLNLTDADLEETKRVYRRYALIFFMFAFLMLLYSCYLVIKHGSIAGLMLSFGAMALFAVQAFKYDFWAFQIQSKKLGLTFKDWRKSFFGGERGHE